MKDPTAAFLVIGDELLSGKVADRNSAYLIPRLRELGVALRRIVILADDVEEIAAAVADASGRFDHVFTSGGVGPTHDDVTFAGVARAFGQSLARHPDLVRGIRAYFGERTNEALLKMAEIPADAEVLTVVDEVVPVVRARNVHILPGVPEFFVRCFEVIARGLRGRPFHTSRIYTTLDEGAIADVLSETQNRFQSVAIGSYPRFDRTDYQVMVSLESRDAAAVAQATAHLRDRFSPSALVEPDGDPPGKAPCEGANAR